MANESRTTMTDAEQHLWDDLVRCIINQGKQASIAVTEANEVIAERRRQSTAP